MSTMQEGGVFSVPSPGVSSVASLEVRSRLADQWPVLSVVLGGTEKTPTQARVCPCSIILKLDGCRLGFCISPEEGDQVAFGVIEDVEKGLDALETELRERRYGWRPRKPNRR